MKKIFWILNLVIVLVGCQTNPSPDEPITATSTIPNIAYTITNVYPHNIDSYTEGLEFHNGFLYESTGDPDYKGNSLLVKTDIKTGKDLQKVNLAKQYFGEGLTMLNGKIYQLTYKENKCFVYDAKTFKLLNTFTYEGQGWGMTNNGKEIIMDSGSNILFYRNPETFAITKTVPVVGMPTSNGIIFINELEYVNGFIYANTWTSDFDKIVKIEAATGKVVGILDFTGVLDKYAPANETEKRDVLNGIAYDSAKNIFYITGKNWPKMFEVKLN
ncbi:MAG: glutaminyl-peptide cyclotransferase [Bacteroidetes bacterium]|nr:glutaminyl-peptide cyclotransferase [Bacteroidota bacterium]MBS1590663.1 glutaminyl-peptide cyclotransferase [Bacteroidota bacterium]